MLAVGAGPGPSAGTQPAGARDRPGRCTPRAPRRSHRTPFRICACRVGSHQRQPEAGMVGRSYACPVPVPRLPVTGPADDAGPDVRVRPGGLQRRAAVTGADARGRGQDLRHRGAAPGSDAGQVQPGPGVAGRGRVGGAGPGLPGRPAGLPELVRLPVREAERPQDRSSPVPVAQGSPAVHPAHPQRLRPAPGRLYVAKVGDVEVRWSRPLPSVPSSVTVIREPDGRYYASFVVEVAAAPLPAVTADIGIDLGLTALGWRCSTGRSARRGRITCTRRRFGWSATTKRSTSRILRYRGWPGPGWRSPCTMPGGPRWSGCWRRRRSGTAGRS
jgi:hypothetical protein